MRKKLTVIDLFAGAGLFSNTFAQEGFQILYAVEIDKTASATYKANLGNHIDIADIRKIKPFGKCDVLIAGPPCQGFSTLGKRNLQDPRNYLSLEIIKWAKKTQPYVIVIENVAAFLTTHVWSKLTDGLSKLKYSVQGQVLNAYDFGVPQIRHRSFTIASKIGLPQIKMVNNRPIRTVKEAFMGLPSKPNNKNFHYAPKPSKLASARMKVIPTGGSKRDVMRLAPELAPPSWWTLGDQVADVWGRMSWNKPCNTLRTCLQNPSKGRYIHPEENRVISLREAARLHTIDDSWFFVGTPTQIARQIGNSVPPKLGQAVAHGIRDLF